MPFAVWCHTCNPHAIIGQGVRFNAEKKKVGYYYSTPIWQFRMKHAACGGTIEIRTDPKNTAYVVTDGGKARDYGDPEDKVREGENGQLILTPEERERRKDDAFSMLEGRVEEKQLGKENQRRIEELYLAGKRDWKDTWSANRRLREGFRRERKRIKRDEDETEALKERLGTEIDILPATEEDAKRAELVSFGEAQDEDAGAKAVFRPSGSSVPRKSTGAKAKENRADILRRQLLSNTRATVNPFGTPKTPIS
jgi:coiled-coil domain-containing protein 130